MNIYSQFLPTKVIIILYFQVWYYCDKWRRFYFKGNKCSRQVLHNAIYHIYLIRILKAQLPININENTVYN